MANFLFDLMDIQVWIIVFYDTFSEFNSTLILIPCFIIIHCLHEYYIFDSFGKKKLRLERC